MACTKKTSSLLLIALLFCSFLLGCGAVASDPTVQPEPEVEVSAVEEEAAEAEIQEVPEVELAANCADGVVKDDGTVETGYGFVPQARDGVYVQEFHADEFPSRFLETVCVCWLKTKRERDIEFEVVFYEAEGNVPAAEPYATVPATATGFARFSGGCGGLL